MHPFRRRRPYVAGTLVLAVTFGGLLALVPPAAAEDATAGPSSDLADLAARIEVVDTLEVPANTHQLGTVFGGISGLDHDPATGMYRAISDDRSENDDARVYTLSLNFDDSGFTGERPLVAGVTTLLDTDGRPFEIRTVDPEAIRVSDGGGYWWTSEGASNAGEPAFIREADAGGAHLRSLALPEAYTPVLEGGVLVAGVRNNLAFESLAYSPDRRTLSAITESALVQDGPVSTRDAESRSRLVSIDLVTGEAVREHVYEVSRIPFAPTEPLPAPIDVYASDRGVSDMVQLSATEFIVLERSFASGVGYQAELFLASTAGADDVSGRFALRGDEIPMTKEPLFDLNAAGVRVDNIEAITWGPDFADGSRSLILAADDNFGFVGSSTQFHLLRVPAALTDVEVQVLGITDFHGRIVGSSSTPGAAVLAGAVRELTAQNPRTVFVSAGDNIGASTFESFVAHDKPTLDALTAAGLEVSAVGNHEFDQGFDDVVDRVMAPYDPVDNPFGGAGWPHLGANLRHAADGSPALPETWTTSRDGITIGFVGVVTADLPTLVSPKHLAGLTIEAPEIAVNRSAAQLRADGADLVVALVHDGAAASDPSSATDTSTAFGRTVTSIVPNVDAIFAGHTHLTLSALVDGVPVIEAGSYGSHLGQALLSVDTRTGAKVGARAEVVPLLGAFPAYADVQAIVDVAVADSAVLGAQVIGRLEAPLWRARIESGAENRGGESTIGNFLAEVQRQATAEPALGGAQLAFINPGGIRDDLVSPDGRYPTDVTIRQAVQVQPFAGSLVNMTLTGADIREALEQQWQPAGASRSFLRLGVSEGFTYTYAPGAAAGERVRDMRLDGVPIEATESYSVTVNSFLAAGGDNFGAFTNGTDARDTGQSDLSTVVDHFSARDVVRPGVAKRAIGIEGMPVGPVRPGDTFELSLSSLAFTGPDDLVPATVTVEIGGVEVASGPVDATVVSAEGDSTGTAVLSVMVPALTTGTHDVTVRTDGGTAIPLAIDVVVGTGATPDPEPTPDPSADPVTGTDPPRGDLASTGATGAGSALTIVAILMVVSGAALSTMRRRRRIG